MDILHFLSNTLCLAYIINNLRTIEALDVKLVIGLLIYHIYMNIISFSHISLKPKSEKARDQIKFSFYYHKFACQMYIESQGITKSLLIAHHALLRVAMCVSVDGARRLARCVHNAATCHMTPAAAHWKGLRAK